MLGSHHHPSVLEGTEDGIWKPTAGKHDNASSGLPLGGVVECALSGDAFPTVKIKESAQTRERRKEDILSGV